MAEAWVTFSRRARENILDRIGEKGTRKLVDVIIVYTTRSQGVEDGRRGLIPQTGSF